MSLQPLFTQAFHAWQCDHVRTCSRIAIPTWLSSPVQLRRFPQQLAVELLEVVVVVAPHHVRQLMHQRLPDLLIPPEALQQMMREQRRTSEKMVGITGMMQQQAAYTHHPRSNPEPTFRSSVRRRREISCPALMLTPSRHTGLMPTLPSGGISLSVPTLQLQWSH